MAPEALGMIGIEAHRLLDPVDPLLRLAQPGQYLALLHHDEIVVGIEAERALLVIAWPCPDRRAPTFTAARMRWTSLSFSSSARAICSSADHLVPGRPRDPRTIRRSRPGRGRRPARHGHAPYFGSSSIARLEQAQRFGIVGPVAAVVQGLAGEHAFIGRHVGRRLVDRAVAGGGFDPPWQGGDDRRRHLVLDGEDVLELAVIALGPHMAVGLGVDQLRA